MSDRRPIVREQDLADYESWAKGDLRDNLGQQVAARRTLELLEEVRLARRLIRGLYHHVPDVPGQEQLQAELERYAGELGVLRPARAPR